MRLNGQSRILRPWHWCWPIGIARHFVSAPLDPCRQSLTVTCRGAACARRWLGLLSFPRSTMCLWDACSCLLLGVGCCCAVAICGALGMKVGLRCERLACLIVVDLWRGRDDGNLAISCLPFWTRRALGCFDRSHSEMLGPCRL